MGWANPLSFYVVLKLINVKIKLYFLTVPKGVSEAMKTISDLIQGDIWIVPNLEGIDSEILKSDQGNFVIEELNKFQVKESGNPPLSFSELERKYFSRGSNVLRKINQYVPNDAKWI